MQCSHQTSFDQENNWPSNTDDEGWRKQSKENLLSFLTGNKQENGDIQNACGLAQTYRSSIPTGRTQVSYIETAKVTETEQCIQECCNRGPEKCQFAWLFASQCFLVGCTEDEKDLCEPMTLTKSGIMSTYYRVTLPSGK